MAPTQQITISGLVISDWWQSADNGHQDVVEARQTSKGTQMAFGILTGVKDRRVARVAALVTLSLVMVGSSLALAEELVAEPVEETEPEPIQYREDDDVIVFSLPDADGLFVDCSPAEVTVDSDPLTTDLEGCFAAGTLGPNGQSNHGQVVRAYVHALKGLEYDGPRGHLVRNIAKSNFGKSEADDAEDVEIEASETDGSEGGVVSEKGKGNKKAKPNKGKP